ncbi:MAG: acetoacetate--CoA ligase [Lautropia sp.]
MTGSGAASTPGLGDVVWQPDPARIARANLSRFADRLHDEWGVQLSGYEAVHRFSVEQMGRFWSSAWDFCGMIGEKNASLAIDAGAAMDAAVWFPDARLNFAENLCRVDDDRVVVSAWTEQGSVRRLTGRALRDEVSRASQAMLADGLRAGDRVAAVMPNGPEALIGMLATTGIGAIWSICSPELGAPATVDRFAQIEPKLLLLTESVVHGGKRFDLVDKAAQIAAGLPGAARVVMLRTTDREPVGERAGRAMTGWSEWLAPFHPVPLTFARFPFAHPCYILFTSGTTGPPKCIVHGAGGTLLKHLVDQQLQHDVNAGDVILRVTSTGWMMWNTLVSGLACEARIVLYDGSPLHPSPRIVWDIAEAEAVTMLGVSPGLLERCERAGLAPLRTHRLDRLKCLVAGGMPMAPATFGYVYRHVGPDLHLASPSGGTDVISFLAGGNPIGPCRAGEIQVPALGIDLQVFDEAGRSVRDTPGELVVARPFPSMPVGFWGDQRRERLRRTYFSRYPGVWTHGDWAEITSYGSVRIHGRSDATLKIRGVRIGTAEIYRPLASFAQVVDAAAVQLPHGDGGMILFVELRSDATLTSSLIGEIGKAIRAQASPRHVPDRIVQAPQLPRTMNGKVSEIAIREAFSGDAVRNRGDLVNPAALAFFVETGRRLAAPASGRPATDRLCN